MVCSSLRDSAFAEFANQRSDRPTFMCGVFGTIGNRGRFGAGMRALRRRGPDDMGIWEDGEHGVALGHRRLSIIDTSAAGHQPMVSRDGRVVMVYNGEIYNFRELRAGLEALG